MTDIAFDFGTGRSDPETFPAEALQQAARKVIGEQAEALTHYPGALGHAGLRRAMARRESERENVPVDPDHIALTNGSMQAVTLTAHALQERRGDVAIVEAFSYPGTLSAYRALGYELRAAPLDEHGMQPEPLRDLLASLASEDRLPRFIYTISTYQNPTGFTMPEARRRELIDVARQFDLPLIEDNCYADVHYEGAIAPAIFALDDDPRHIYFGSLSKILAPGFRLGYVLARPPMLERILALRSDAGSNTLAAAIAAEFYKDGISAHADRANGVLKAKRDLLLSRLSDELDDSCVWSKPPGGLFVWLRFPDDVDRQKLLSEADARGVKYLPGAAFHYRNRDVPYLRLAFGHLTQQQIADGVTQLAAALQSARTSNESRRFDSLFD